MTIPFGKLNEVQGHITSMSLYICW